MVFNWYRSAVCYVLPILMLSVIGCGGSDKEKENAKPSDSQKAQAPSNNPSVPKGTKALLASGQNGTNPALGGGNPAVDQQATKQIEKLLTRDPSNPIVGTWAGMANINQDIFKQLLARIPESDRKPLIAKKNAFLSTQIAVDLYSNGSFSQVVAMTGVDGKQIVQEIQGTWKVAEKSGDSFQVDLEESFTGSKVTEKSRVNFRIHPDGNQMIRPATVDKDLERCEPMFVFARPLKSAPTSQVAEGPVKSTTLK